MEVITQCKSSGFVRNGAVYPQIDPDWNFDRKNDKPVDFDLTLYLWTH